MGEVELAALLCAFLGGSEAETRHHFDVDDRDRHVRVDCETAGHVVEIGLDGTASARDSLHQALFSAHLTGKSPAIILIDSDGRVGRYEHEMRHVARPPGCSTRAAPRPRSCAGRRPPRCGPATLTPAAMTCPRAGPWDRCATCGHWRRETVIWARDPGRPAAPGLAVRNIDRTSLIPRPGALLSSP